MKKIISLSLTLLLVMSALFVFPANAETEAGIITGAAYQACSLEGVRLLNERYISSDGSYEFAFGEELNDEEIPITNEKFCYITKFLDKKAKKVVIPEVIDGHIVREICEESFAGSKNLKTIVMNYNKNLGEYGNYFEAIGKGAFKNCTSLKKVVIKKGIVIDDEAFMNCRSLSSVTLKMRNYIGDKAFYNCHSLKKITVYGSLSSMGVKSVGYCGNAKVKGFRLVTKTTARYSKDKEQYLLPNYVDGRCIKSVFSINQNSFFRYNHGQYYHETLPGAQVQLLYRGKRYSTWKSNNPSQVSITDNGKLTVLSDGITKISITENGRKHIFQIKARYKPRVRPSEINIKKGKTKTMHIIGKAPGQKIRFYQNNETAIFVNADPDKSVFKIKGVKPGRTNLKLRINGVLQKVKIIVEK